MTLVISKSDFKIGSSCNKKLWYKKSGYPTKNDEDQYMQFLAKGGYIVGKMAQLIYSGGIDLSNIRNYYDAFHETQRLLESSTNIILYEAAVVSNNKVARVDILEKVGDEIRIIEVKAKSQDSEDENEKIPDDYLHDLLFQVVTVEEAFPQHKIKGYLFLPDKSKLNMIEGLAGWFNVAEDHEVDELDELAARSTKFSVPTVTFKYAGHPNEVEYLKQLRENSIMELRDVNELDYNNDWSAEKESIKQIIQNLYKSVLENHDGVLNKECKKCEYISDESGKNGFRQCWKDFEGKDISAMDLYYGGSVQRGKGNFYLNDLIQAKTLSLFDIDIDVLTKGKDKDSLSARTIRQLLQIDGAKTNAEQVNIPFLRTELSSMSFPLHFIDFETYTGAIPFHVKMRPYELIAFQWSCHSLFADGTIKHTEWINTEDAFPNFRFAEELMKVVGNSGTPLMWSHHENTVLRRVLEQMDIREYSNDELKNWLGKMVHDKKKKQAGRLVDMAKTCEVAYLHPDCKGKVSIKKILPAIWSNVKNNDLHTSELFKSYFQKDESGAIKDPYETLSPVKEIVETMKLEAEEAVKEGTGAMKAYHELMYGKGQLNSKKKKEIASLLLQYCKLDTLAMVIIYSYWKKLTS